MSYPPTYIVDILSRFDDAGYSAYLVGGCVRDILRNKRPGDYDITTSATPDQVKRLFRRTIPTGVRHGTVTVVKGGRHIEVTTFRRDGVYLDSRRPESVSFDASLTEDLRRRDFTINAMAMGINGSVIDPFGGQDDLDKGIIRAVGEPSARFEEDALRMLRALRFSSRMGFHIEAGTLDAIRSCAALCKKLSAERVRDELLKILAAKSTAHIELTVNLGLLDTYLNTTSHPMEFHMPRGGIKRYSAEFTLSLFCLALAAEGYIEEIAGFLRTLRMDNATISRVISAVGEALAGIPRDRVYIKRLLSRVGGKNARTACELCDFLAGGRKRADICADIVRTGECASLAALAVNGNDIMHVTGVNGREVGAVLQKLLDHVIERPFDNDKITLLGLAKDICDE